MRVLIAAFVVAATAAGGCGNNGGEVPSGPDTGAPADDGGPVVPDAVPSGAPTVVDLAPADGASDVSPTAVVEAVFSEPMDPATIDVTTFRIAVDGAPITGTVTYDDAARRARFVPDDRLALRGHVTAIITAGVRDADGATLAADHPWAFTIRDGAWSAPHRVEQGAGSVDCPHLVVDASGRATAAWIRYESAIRRVWVARRAADAWGEAEALSAAGVIADCPRLAVDGAGRVTAVWEHSLTDVSDVWTSRLTPETGWSAPAPIATGASFVDTPDVAATAGGEVMVVWAERAAGGGRDLTASRRDGDTWTAPFIIGHDRRDPSGGEEPRVTAGAPPGGFLAVWPAALDGQAAGLWASRFDGAWAAPVLVADEDAGGVDVAVDGRGRAVAAWSIVGNPATRTRTARFDGTWQPAADLDATERGAAAHRVAVASTGHAVAAWIQLGSNGAQVAARTYHATAGWEPAVILDTDGVEVYRPAVVITGAGHALVVWTENAGTGSDVPTSRRLWASRRVAGGAWNAPTRIESAAGWAIEPQLAVDAAGRVTAVWLQCGPCGPGAPYSVWSARFE